MVFDGHVLAHPDGAASGHMAVSYGRRLGFKWKCSDSERGLKGWHAKLFSRREGQFKIHYPVLDLG